MSARLWAMASVATVFCIGAAGVGFWLAYSPLQPIVFSRLSLQLATAPIEGDTVDQQVVLRNPNRVDLRVAEIRASCGCSKVVHRNGSDFEEGEVIPANGTLDLLVTVNTAGQVSPRKVHVEIGAIDPRGRPVPPAHAEIIVPVKAGPRIAPVAVIFEDVVRDTEAVQELLVTDGQDDPVKIKEVKFSDRDHFHARIVTVDSALRTQKAGMKPAHRIVVSYRASHPPEMSSEFVEVSFEPTRFAPLRVPIYVRSSQRRPGFVPEKLVLIPSPGQTTLTRKVTLITGGRAGGVNVVSLPTFVKAEVAKPGGEECEIELAIDMEALAAAAEGQQLVVSFGDGKEYTLPIKALALK